MVIVMFTKSNDVVNMKLTKCLTFSWNVSVFKELHPYKLKSYKSHSPVKQSTTVALQLCSVKYVYVNDKCFFFITLNA